MSGFWKTGRLFSLLLFVTLFFAIPREVFALNPAEELELAVKQAQGVLNNGNVSPAEQDRMLRQIVYPLFDFPETLRLVIGRHWPADSNMQKEYTELFTALLERRYFGYLKRLKDAMVLFRPPKIKEDMMEVVAEAKSTNGQEVRVAFKLHQRNGKWLIYDFVVSDMSMVSNYRSQLNEILGKFPATWSLEKKFNALLEHLRAKLKEPQDR